MNQIVSEPVNHHDLQEVITSESIQYYLSNLLQDTFNFYIENKPKISDYSLLGISDVKQQQSKRPKKSKYQNIKQIPSLHPQFQQKIMNLTGLSLYNEFNQDLEYDVKLMGQGWNLNQMPSQEFSKVVKDRLTLENYQSTLQLLSKKGIEEEIDRLLFQPMNVIDLKDSEDFYDIDNRAYRYEQSYPNRQTYQVKPSIGSYQRKFNSKQILNQN
ncbi:UNKNOWN [Stylonychia lemnae]|uniref:Uncharacterized protein n=1 Tax=Stylonychia lemnae TaxID=5949 RepID=A0A077ZYT2_STYLE|nr:UNKNOWN [Stylonychia lemnae]|eukprot:CDW74777.1 UNKNOWN [Stylonychia lemnae]